MRADRMDRIVLYADTFWIFSLSYAANINEVVKTETQTLNIFLCERKFLYTL